MEGYQGLLSPAVIQWSFSKSSVTGGRSAQSSPVRFLPSPGSFLIPICPRLAAFLCQSAPLCAGPPEAGLLKAHGVDAAETDGERFGADLGGGRGWGPGSASSQHRQEVM